MGTLARPVRSTSTEGTGKSTHPPRVQPASANVSKKSNRLRELLDEIRALRQDVRRMNDRLEREQSARSEPQKPTKASSPLGHDHSAIDPAEFVDLVSQPPSAAATKSLKPGETLFLLATPRVIAQDAKEELSSAP